jgi:YD repeat-containing protein
MYGPGGELRDMKYYAGEFCELNHHGTCMYYRPTYHQTRTYNSRLQLTRITANGAPDPLDPNYSFSSAPPAVDLEYRFSPTANDGRITQRKDWVTGEEVNYGYDSLGRLSSAVTTGPEWGLNFVSAT